MDYVLTDEYIEDARKRAYRFQGQWCGTSGSLAADTARLLKERERLMTTISTLEEQNAALRSAVETRIAGGCCDGGKCQPQVIVSSGVFDTSIDEKGPLVEPDESDDEATSEIPSDWILQGQRELEAAPDDIRWTGDSILATPADGLRPGSREFVDVLDEIKDLHLRKTLDYGVDEDALSNIRESAEIVNMPAWAGAILRISDKMHRLKAYFRRGKVEFDGLSDTLKDIASYAVIAEVLRRETEQA